MASKEVEYQQATRPKRTGVRGAWDNFCNTLYDPVNKTCFGRTGSSWAKITVFYLIYYGFLAAFFACALLIFFQTLDDVEPSQTGMQSLLKGNPGMGFRPMPNVESTLVKFTQGEPKTYSKYVKHINEFIASYPSNKSNSSDDSYNTTNSNVVDCDKVDPEPHQACRFDPDKEAGPCTAGSSYGYDEGEPCILLKLNRIYGWEPEPFNNETINEDNEHAHNAKKALGDNFNPDFIGITCEGENPGDQDNRGSIEFYPKYGFPLRYFPFMNQKGYQTPFVFARFPNIKEGVIVQVWCKAWAKNIYHHKNDKAGSIHLELLMD